MCVVCKFIAYSSASSRPSKPPNINTVKPVENLPTLSRFSSLKNHPFGIKTAILTFSTNFHSKPEGFSGSKCRYWLSKLKVGVIDGRGDEVAVGIIVGSGVKVGVGCVDGNPEQPNSKIAVKKTRSLFFTITIIFNEKSFYSQL